MVPLVGKRTKQRHHEPGKTNQRHHEPGRDREQLQVSLPGCMVPLVSRHEPGKRQRTITATQQQEQNLSSVVDIFLCNETNFNIREQNLWKGSQAFKPFEIYGHYILK